MKAKERERRWESQYVLEKDTHRHTRRDGESASPGVPTPDKVATGFGLGSPNFPRPETSQMGRRGTIRYSIPNSFSLYREATTGEKIIKTSSNSGSFVTIPRQIRSQSPLSLTEASHLPHPGHDPSTDQRSELPLPHTPLAGSAAASAPARPPARCGVGAGEAGGRTGRRKDGDR